ncbi:sensor domain-containing diguanylate cyclase [Nitrosophilus alvini]|uniref:sensor domain-containing diguanylate cyclase n=1 Tax=Nitrosophilus alvini TaxID=2714855 RepID=UPI00190E01F7|nr:GGDEF domain-containing protein [Nitrosophilus alvini]
MEKAARLSFFKFLQSGKRSKSRFSSSALAGLLENVLYFKNNPSAKSKSRLFQSISAPNRKKEDDFFLKQIFDHLEEAVYYKNRNFRYININTAFAALVKKEKDSIIGFSDFEIFKESFALKLREMEKKVFDKNKSLKKFFLFDGKYLEIILHPLKDSFGKTVAIAGIVKDKTEEKAFVKKTNAMKRYFKSRCKKLELLSMCDSLTNIYNRYKFDIALEQETKRSKRYGLPLSLILFDIDDFKNINDEFGHIEGDKILKKIAKTVKQNIRDIDIFARIGGDEFAILVPNTSLKEIEKITDKLKKSIENMKTAKIKTTCSFGIAEYKKGETKEDFFKRTDVALYRAKRMGKNRVSE